MASIGVRQGARAPNQLNTFRPEAPGTSPDEESGIDHGAVMACQDNLDFMRGLPDGSMKLIVTSPPYNIGKQYEKRSSLDTYLSDQEHVIAECVRLLHPNGSLCWQVGNYVEDGEVVPLDVVLYPLFRGHGLKLRNRIVWHFEHGLHCTKRLSGRYETINWFTRDGDYTFDVDPIRVPSKYPGKRHFKGPQAGKLSGNPKGKEPWRRVDIPQCQEQPRRKDHPSLPVSRGACGEAGPFDDRAGATPSSTLTWASAPP